MKKSEWLCWTYRLRCRGRYFSGDGGGGGGDDEGRVVEVGAVPAHVVRVRVLSFSCSCL